MAPEDAPEYRTPGPRALTPRERAFRRWLESEGNRVLVWAVEAPDYATDDEELAARNDIAFRTLEAAFAAGWEAGRNVG